MTTATTPLINDEETCYMVSVPIYVNVSVCGKKGLSDEEVISLALEEGSLDDEEYHGEQVEDVLKGWVKPCAPIEVEVI